MRTTIYAMLGWALLTCAGTAHADESADPMATCKAEWVTVLQSLPAHPLAPQALECFVDAKIKAGAADRCAALMAIAEAEPDSDLGLYAIDAWYPACGVGLDQAQKSALMSAHADTRLATHLCELLGSEYSNIDDYIKSLGLEFDDLEEGMNHGEVLPVKLLSLLLRWASKSDGTDVAFLKSLLLIEYLPRDFASSSTHRARLFPMLTANLETYHLPAFAHYFESLTRTNNESAEYALPFLQAVPLNALLGAIKEGRSPIEPIWTGRNDSAALQTAINSTVAPESKAFIALQLLAVAFRERNVEVIANLLTSLEAVRPALDATSIPPLHVIAATRTYLHDASTHAPGDALGTLLRESADRYTKDMMAEVQKVAASDAEKTLSSGFRAWLIATAAQLQREARFLAEAECLRLLLDKAPKDDEAAAWSARLGKIESGVWRNSAAEAALLRTQWTRETDETKRNAGMLAEARALYRADSVKEARTLIQRALLGAPDTQVREDAQILEILCEFKLGDVEEAKVLINDFISRNPDSPLLPQVNLLRAYMMTIWGDFGEAMMTCERLEGLPLDHEQQRKTRELMKDLAEIVARPVEPELDEVAKAQPKIILISLDTTRPDRLGCYGNTAARTPAIDRLAAMGTVFERAYSTSSWTKPAHASVFTGRYPLAHGAQGYDDMIAPRAAMLPEIVQALGYRTMAAVSAPPLNSLYGFDRGFDYYDDFTYEFDRVCNLFDYGNAGEVKIHSGATSGIIMHSAMLAYNRIAKPDRPLFFFINYFDAHHNYQPIAPYNEATRNSYYGNQWGMIDGWVQGAQPVDTAQHPVDRARLLALYDDEIASIDRQVYTWHYRVEMEKKVDNTYFVIFGDHGDEFMEHGSLTHGHSLYEEVLRVPFIICGPGVPKGARINTPVSLVDIMPTLLALLGQPVPDDLDGQNLVPLMQGTAQAPRPIYASLNLQAFEGYAVIEGDEKFIANTRDKVYALYDLGDDPGEKKDLAPLRPERLQYFSDLMVRHQDAQRQKGLSLDAGALVTQDSLPTMDALMEQFRAMGYIGN